MTGFIITKYHELIRFFIKNLTRMSLKLEKPEKIRISFKCYFFLFFGIFRIPTACLWLPICQNIFISRISRPFHVFHQLERHFLLHTAPLIPPYYSVFPLCRSTIWFCHFRIWVTALQLFSAICYTTFI